MRSDVRDFTLIAPGSLSGVLAEMAKGGVTPIAGGTELMVALGVGRLQPKNLISLGDLTELRFLNETPEALVIGAGTTFTDLRRSALVAREFGLLARTAAWTGSIANQNRGTLGGNIANASPAADNPPALLVYDAVLELVSVRGRRMMPYTEFHLGYKKTALAADELIYAVHLPRRASGYREYVRKVGTRNAQAISKIALAGVARLDGGIVQEIRLAGASLVDRPVRLFATEAAIAGKAITAETRSAAAAALAREIAPIDDIRSTAKYRVAVVSNLLDDFLTELV